MILGRERLMGSLLSRTHFYAHYVPRTLMYPSLSHVDVHISAHHFYTLGILWCMSSTLQFIFILINKLQIHHVRARRCTLGFRSLRSVFLLWMKIFTTTHDHHLTYMLCAHACMPFGDHPFCSMPSNFK